MDKETSLLCMFIIFPLLSTIWTEANGAAGKVPNGHVKVPVKLFVFGDSYVDTGNSQKSATGSWRPPYGMTFPGKPTGRFSDGGVLTDYLAAHLGIETPIPYKQRKETRQSQYGINFAHGGTGVFNTMVSDPNMTTQIDIFQQFIEQNTITKHDLNTSIALVSLGGNDYATYTIKKANPQDISKFSSSVVNQLTTNLQRIHSLGVQKVAVTAIEPMGCLPQLTSYASYKNCSETSNKVSDIHNTMLQQSVQKLNNELKKNVFVTLDLYHAFLSAFKDKVILKLRNPLEPCCVGMSKEFSCGSVDKSGAKKYVVCNNPELSFFWDAIHPSQSGWHAVYLALKSSLNQLYS